ncbi:MAG: hypothetical protein V4591_09380 [Bdellovibrionota bacterium]
MLLFQGAYGQGFKYIFHVGSFVIFGQFTFYYFLVVYLALIVVVVWKKLYKNYLIQFFFLFWLVSWHCYASIPSWGRADYLILSNVFPLLVFPLYLAIRYSIPQNKFCFAFQILLLVMVIGLIPFRYHQVNQTFPFYKSLVSATEKIYKEHKEINGIVLPTSYANIDSTIIYEGLGGKINQSCKTIAYIDEGGSITYK